MRDHSKVFPLKDREWNKGTFRTDGSLHQGDTIILESEVFWIPAEILPGNDDQRELGVLVREIRIF
jgi:hypothetical protein